MDIKKELTDVCAQNEFGNEEFLDGLTGAFEKKTESEKFKRDFYAVTSGVVALTATASYFGNKIYLEKMAGLNADDDPGILMSIATVGGLASAYLAFNAYLSHVSYKNSEIAHRILEEVDGK